MQDEAIHAFFADRKGAWLKKASNASMDEAALAELEQQAEQLFSIEEWLPNAAKRAGQISMATHPCTFSHPSARKNKNGAVTPVIANASPANDGFIRYGNLNTATDALGNAAALDVYKFLNLELSDGNTLVQHISQETEVAKALLDIPTEAYEVLRAGFMQMLDSGTEPVTSSKIKQVYFPVDSGYHLLSILTHSGLVFELRKRLDAMRFSEAQKSLRDLKKNNQHSASPFREIYNLTTIGYGGTKPQNISVLNNQNGGKAHLLHSLPPILERRAVRLPNQDVFSKALYGKPLKPQFLSLHKIFLARKGGNIPLEKLRTARDRVLNDILSDLLEQAWAWRSVSNQQFHKKRSSLPLCQQIWLCEQYKEQRLQEDSWLREISDSIAAWISTNYTELIPEPLPLGAAEQRFLKDWCAEQAEVLRA